MLREMITTFRSKTSNRLVTMCTVIARRPSTPADFRLACSSLIARSDSQRAKSEQRASGNIDRRSSSAACIPFRAQINRANPPRSRDQADLWRRTASTDTEATIGRPRHAFFLGRLLSGLMPFDDSNDTVGPAAGFLDFGFFGSRLPRFCPLAIVRSCPDDWGQRGCWLQGDSGARLRTRTVTDARFQQLTPTSGQCVPAPVRSNERQC